MIKNLISGPGIDVLNNVAGPYIDQNNSNPMQGMLRIWGTDLQVFNGSAWVNVYASSSMVALDPEVLDLLAWARKKKFEESEMQQLSETHPAVKIAVENLKKAQEQLEVTTILSKDQ